MMSFILIGNVLRFCENQLLHSCWYVNLRPYVSVMACVIKFEAYCTGLIWAFCSPFPSGIPKVELRTGIRSSLFSVCQIESVPHSSCSGDDKKAQGHTTWCCFCQGTYGLYIVCVTWMNQWMGLCFTALYLTCHLWIWTKHAIISLKQ